VIVGAVVPEQQGFCQRSESGGSRPSGLQSRIVITDELEIEQVQRWYQRLTILRLHLAQTKALA